VRKFEGDLVRATGAIRANFNPAATMVIGFDSHFLGYRHAAYYLPEFLTVQYPAVRTVEGTRIFAVRSRRTELLGSLPLGAYREFVVFPLPDGADYEKYAALQLARLPGPCLHRMDRVRPTLVSGDAQALGYLFAEDRSWLGTPPDTFCKPVFTPMVANERKPGISRHFPLDAQLPSNLCEPLAQ
jgi:hypothetical protein